MLFKRIFFVLTILLLYKCTLSAQTGAFTIPYRSAARDSAGTFQPDLRYFKQGGNSFGVLGTIGTIDAQDLQFNTSNLSRLYITSGGNIGINTISPQYKLDINGSINSTQLVTNGYNQFLTLPTTYFGGNTLSFNTVGNKLTQDEDFANGFNGLISYNNAGGGALNIYRINTAITNNPIPNSSGYYLKIQVDNSSFGTNPGWGGFEAYPSNLTLNRMYLQRFRALIPVGYTIYTASNSLGTNSQEYFLTNNVGTGKWEEYIVVIKTGNTGSISSSTHIYLSGGATPTVASPLIWYVSSSTVIDITDQSNQSIGGIISSYGANMNSSKITGLANGTISSDAAAYGQIATSVNTAVSGTIGYISKFTNTNVIGSSQIQDNGTNVGIGVAPSAYKLRINGESYATRFISEGNTASIGSTAFGLNTLSVNTGVNNTAIGNAASYLNTSGINNTSLGLFALYSNTTNNNNTAIGSQSLLSSTGNANTALGSLSLYNNSTGSYNLGLGADALLNNTTGNYNIGIGALYIGSTLKTGSNNTILGYGSTIVSVVKDSSLNNTLALGTYGRLVMYSDSTGNTSIGSPALLAPKAILDINGITNLNSFRITSLANGLNPTDAVNKTQLDSASTMLRMTGTTGTIPYFSSANMIASSTINYAGNSIGFNSTSPQATIDYGATLSNKIYWYNNSTGLRYGIGINSLEYQMYLPGTAHFTWNTGGDLQASGTGELMRLNATNGFLGVGIAPNYKLDINGTTNTIGLNTSGIITFTGLSTGVSSDSVLVLTNGVAKKVAQSSIGQGNVNTAVSGTIGYVPKFTSTNVIGISKLTDNGTNIGVGIFNPQYLFHVYGTTGSASGIGIEGTGTGAQVFQLYPSTSQSLILLRPGLRLAAFLNNGSVGLGNVGSDIGGGSILFVDGPNARVGINNTAPSYSLQVTGQAYSTRFISEGNVAGLSNTAFGQSTLNAVTSGTYNTGVGTSSLYFLTSGSYNTGLGYNSNFNTTSGNYNTAIGTATLQNNTSGSQNTAIGVNALQNNTSGNYNTAIGITSGQSLKTGSSNTIIGYGSTIISAVKDSSLNNTLAIGTVSRLTMYSDSTGNTSIGIPALSAPKQALDVNGYIKSRTGVLDGNMFPVSSWSDLLGQELNGVTYQNATYVGTAGDSIVYNNAPDGKRTLMLKTTEKGVSVNGGGINDFSVLNIDNKKSYRYSIYFKINKQDSAYIYLGTGFSYSGINNLDGTNNNNPYNVSFNLQGYNVVVGRWYLMTGFIHAVGDTSLTSSSAAYDLTTGAKIYSGIDFKFIANQVNTGIRFFTYYANNVATKGEILWHQPRFEEINGREPSLDQLLNVSGQSAIAITNNSINSAISGTINNLAKFTAGNAISNSAVSDNGTNIIISKDNTSAFPGQLLIQGVSNINQNLYVGYNTTNNYGYIQPQLTGTGYKPLLLNAHGGNVGINTDVNTMPTYPLTITGQAYATRFISEGNTIGVNSTAFGFNTLNVSTGTNNTAIGSAALYSNTSGYNNTALGLFALYSNTINSNSTAVGSQSLYLNTGIASTAVGSLSLYNNTTGNYNVAMGVNSLVSNSTGSYNVGIGGVSAGNGIKTGSNNTIIGYAGTIISAIKDSSLNNTLALGTYSRMILYSDSTGNIGLNTTTPQFTLDIAAGGNAVTRLKGGNIGGIYIEDAKTFANINTYTDSSLRITGSYFYNAATTDLVIKNNNVGIGLVPTSFYKFQVAGTTNLTNLNITGTSTLTGLTTGVSSDSVIVATNGVLKKVAQSSIGVGNINTAVAGTANTIPRFTSANILGNSSITDNGSVGIGNASPAYKLDVAGAFNSTQLNLSSYAQFKTITTSYVGADVIGWNVEGNKLNPDEDFASGTNSVNIYNNNGGTAVTMTRTNTAISGNTIPNSSGYYIKIVTDNSSLGSSPNWGGFYQYQVILVYNHEYLQRFRALIPVGYSLSAGSNSIGNNSQQYFISNINGTGKWEEYVVYTKAGDAGTIATSFFISLYGGTTPTVGSPLIWYLSSATVIDITDQNNKSIGGIMSSYGANMNSSKITSVANGTASSDGAAFGQISTGVNAAVSGTSGQLAQFTGSNSIGNSGILATSGILDFSTGLTPKIYYYNGNTGSRFGIGVNGSELQNYITTGSHWSWNTGGDFQTSGTNEVMRLTGSGNLGIGTTTPGYKLDVNGTGNISGGLNISSGATISGGLAMSSGKITGLANGTVSSDAAAFGQIATSINTAVSGTSGYHAKFNGTNTLTSSLIYDNGTQIGVNTATLDATLTLNGTLHVLGNSGFGIVPSYPLDVNGNIRMQNLTTAAVGDDQLSINSSGLVTRQNPAVYRQGSAMNNYFNGSNFQLAGGTYWGTGITGSRNTGFGLNGYSLTTTAADNTIIGYNALNTITTGTGNTAVGSSAGSSVTTTLTNSTLIGSSSTATGNLTNATAIGYAAGVTQSNSLVLGGTGTNAVNVGINTTMPAYRLDVNAYNNTIGDPLRLQGLNIGAKTDSILTSNAGVVKRMKATDMISKAWSITFNQNVTTYTLDFQNYSQGFMRLTVPTSSLAQPQTTTLTATNVVDGGIYTINYMSPGSVSQKFLFDATFAAATGGAMPTQTAPVNFTTITFMAQGGVLYLTSINSY